MVLAALGLWVVSGQVLAVPFASKITLQTLTVEAEAGTSISYFLNESPAAVEIEIVDEATSVVAASFAGGTGQGENTVVWNGRADNDDGAVVPAGHYRVAVSAEKTHTAWTEIASHRSLQNSPPPASRNELFAGFSPLDVLVVPSPENPFFGSYLALQGGGISPRSYAMVELHSDLSVVAGDDGHGSRIFREAGLETANSTNFYSLRRTCMDPEDENVFYVAGEGSSYFYYGNTADPANLHSAAGAVVFPSTRVSECLVVMEGSQKYAFFVIERVIYKAPMTGRELSGPLQQISYFDSSAVVRGLAVDQDSNLYCTFLQLSGVLHSGVLYRFPAAEVSGPTPTLLESSNNWRVNISMSPKNMYLMGNPAICPFTGDVFIFTANTGNKSAAGGGIYKVGNVETANLYATLSIGEHRVVDTSSWHLEAKDASLRYDTAGNAILSDRVTGQVRVYSPDGLRKTRVPAPASQRLTVTPRAAVAHWDLY